MNSGEKKPYTTPSLKKYGQLKDLTASGSQAGSEGTGTGNKNKKA
jgi:hypothetical protein